MKILSERKYAFIIAVITVILTMVISGTSYLSSQATSIENKFYNGERDDGLSIYNDLKDLIEISKNVLNIAQKANVPQEDIDSLTKAIQLFDTAKNPKDYYQVYQAIEGEIDNIAVMIVMFTDDETLNELFEKYAVQYVSKTNTITYDPYNKYVREYNELTSKFPANILSKLPFVKEVSAFE